MKKYLIVGLGNMGAEYHDTRHNIGFKILDELADLEEVSFETQKLGDLAKFKFKGRTFILLKPSTFMNLSGKSVQYWMMKEKIAIENILVICDDLNLPFGSVRVKARGSDGGHNGLKNINQVLNTQQYARFRFGISNEFSKGRQSDYVLSKWNEEEQQKMPERLKLATQITKSFGTSGLKNTMNDFNGK
ncbi:MAG: aminoacyl-tRNA hydrolase [Flavobacteriaceae bacterium]|nr:aminoacyl-tRNA hydrolase [Flavobacteriaceae bacterium]